jgi:hypothetical protein
MMELLRADLQSVGGARFWWEERLDRPRRFCEKLLELVGMDALTRRGLRTIEPACGKRGGEGSQTMGALQRREKAPHGKKYAT